MAFFYFIYLQWLAKSLYNDYTNWSHQNTVSKQHQTSITLEKQNGTLCPVLRHGRLLDKIKRRRLVLMLKKLPPPQFHLAISRMQESSEALHQAYHRHHHFASWCPRPGHVQASHIHHRDPAAPCRGDPTPLTRYIHTTPPPTSTNRQ
jgi:hypothetical protein